ncbi:right-handed parallel beta-helix repeat-containing protein [Sphingomonas azotifigens]|uniref:right-handed parallel beta-helix repeat-containing protein n=1 Tax=Sphingomonas azotifigens TaxID=330920 RepID=UPI0014322884|nr:right-handed parallel beta-helix repeat-containing protein [Sphingomonas azotifigens]
MSLAVLALMTTVTVSTPGELAAAIGKARGGDVVVLAPGDYQAQRFIGTAYSSPVVFRSQDPKRPARISQLNMKDARNVTFQDIEFTRIRGSEPHFAAVIVIADGSNIVFRGGSVHGSLNDNARDDFMGIHARRPDRLQVIGVTFKQLSVALGIENGTNFVVQDSSFSELATDAMEIPGALGGLIERNHFFNYQPNPGAHTDAIQCWTLRQKSGCKDMVIRGNWFDSAPGKEFQGVFFADEDNVGGYDRIEVSNNKFTGTAWHAINIDRGVDIVIKDNILIAGPTARPWIKTAGPAVVTGNVAPTYIIAGKPGVPKGNKIGGIYKK